MAAVGLAAVGGCSEVFGPDPIRVPEEDLTIISVDPDAPPLTQLEVDFWAVQGQEREVQIRYQYQNGANGKCLRFVVPAESLLRHPNGRRVAAGDSVQIKIRVLDPQLYLFEFDPQGLDFDPDHPARIEVRYVWASLDLDGDGIEGDPDDFAIRSRFGLWKQERAGESWEHVASSRDEEKQELVAEVTGFTRYALAAD